MPEEAGFSIDCAFPGGNIVLERSEGADVFVHQDLRDTAGDWFYWCFRVRGAQGRTLRFHFTKSNVIGVRGPAVSLDAGHSWQWLGTDGVDGQSFTYAFGADAENVRFSFGMPYQESNLRAFTQRHRGAAGLIVEPHCTSRKGRQVERLRAGCLDRAPAHRVLLGCRHHCCEMMASYAVEGIMEQVLSDTPEGNWLREYVEFLVLPFADKDGVEDGDQGKNREPRDHGRDYAGTSLYPETGALRDYVPVWSEDRLRAALDLHCPAIRGPHNEVIYLVGSQEQIVWREQSRFSQILEAVQQGPLRHSAKDNLPFGQAWNKAKNYSKGKGMKSWAQELPGVKLASGIELPYANAAGGEVNQETARLFGHDLARALRAYLGG